tara:strand:+ start:26742 stop:27146 length:405 start_codon:yes stop_codon:yes gene_type:complete
MSSNPFDSPSETYVSPSDPPSQDDRNLALIAHLSGCVGIVAGGLIGFVGPLIIYLLKKDTSAYVAEQAKEALNFQITLFLIAIVCLVITAISCFVAFPIMFVPMVLQLVFGIIAALAVRDGTDYRYPFNMRLVQ